MRPVTTARRCQIGRVEDRGQWLVRGVPGSPSAARADGRVRRSTTICAVVDDGGGLGVFAAEKPGELWLTDITEHKTAEGKLYLCAIKDVFSGRIVGYSIDSPDGDWPSRPPNAA